MKFWNIGREQLASGDVIKTHNGLYVVLVAIFMGKLGSVLFAPFRGTNDPSKYDTGRWVDYGKLPPTVTAWRQQRHQTTTVPVMDIADANPMGHP